MQEFIHQQGNQENGHPTPSLSVGIAIAHHLDLLQRVRNITQEAERSAKRVPGKNALAITLSKRSGEDYRIAGRWGDLDISLQRLVSFARQGAIPTGTAYELRELALRLGLSLHERLSSSQKQSPHGQYVEVIQLDALRIIRRKLQVLQGKFPKQQAEAVERFFKARLGIEQAPHPDRADIHPVSLGELINELIVAQLLAKAQQLAMPQKEESRRWRM